MFLSHNFSCCVLQPCFYLNYRDRFIPIFPSLSLSQEFDFVSSCFLCLNSWQRCFYLKINFSQVSFLMFIVCTMTFHLLYYPVFFLSVFITESIVAMTKWFFVASIFSVVVFITTFLPLLSLVLLYLNLWDQIFFATMIHLEQFLCLYQNLSAIVFFSLLQVSFTFSNLTLIWNRTLYLLMYKNMLFSFLCHLQPMISFRILSYTLLMM